MTPENFFIKQLPNILISENWVRNEPKFYLTETRITENGANVKRLNERNAKIVRG